MSGSDTTRMMIDRINAEQREWKSKRSGIDKKPQSHEELHKDEDYSYLFEDDEQSMSSDDDMTDDDMDSLDTPIDDADNDDLPDALKQFNEFLNPQIDKGNMQPSIATSNIQVTTPVSITNKNNNQSVYTAHDDLDTDNDFDSFDGDDDLSDIDDVVRAGQRIPAGFDVLGESNVVQHDGQHLSRHVRVLLDEATSVEYLMFTDERGITVIPRYNADGSLRTGAIIDTVF